MDIDKRLDEIQKEHALIMNKKYELEKEFNSYFYIINLCNSSDHCKHFIKDNPDWEYRNNITFIRNVPTDGYLENVQLKILKHKISKEDFIKEARKIVSPLVGNQDFDNFERNQK